MIFQMAMSHTYNLVQIFKDKNNFVHKTMNTLRLHIYIAAINGQNI